MKKIISLTVVTLFFMTFYGCFAQYYADRANYEYHDEYIIIVEPLVPVVYPADPVVIEYHPSAGTGTIEKMRKNSSSGTKERTNTDSERKTKLRDLNSGSRQTNSDGNGSVGSERNNNTQVRNTNNSRSTSNDSARQYSRSSDSSDNNTTKKVLSSSKSRR